MKRLLATASAYAVMASLCAPAAFAQTGDSDLADDTIVVTGFKKQNRDSIAAKQASDLVADFLSADELGRQPDLNVADSLRRLPGVTTIFDEDEGRFVSLRGLDQRYTYIGINGGQIASTDRSDRDINIESIPPTAVTRLEVYKSVTPDLDGQSVGGVINLVTRSAFDADGFYAVANGIVGVHNQIGDLPGSFSDPSFRFDGAVSDLFLNDTLGVFVSGTYFDKKRDQGRPIVGSRSNDAGAFVDQVLPLDYANQIKRWNVLANIDYRPTDWFQASVLYSRFNYQYAEERYRFDLIEERENLTQTGPETGFYSETRGRARFDRFPLGQRIDTVQGRVTARPTEKVLFEGGVSYSNGRQDHPEPNASWGFGPDPALGYSYDLSTSSVRDTSVPTIVLNDPSVLSDLSAWEFESYTDGFFANEEDVTEFFGDLSYNTEGEDAGLGFKVGYKYRNLEKSRSARATRYTLIDGETLSLEGFVDPNQTPPPTTEYFGEGLNYPVVNPDLFDAFFEANRGLFEAEQLNRDSSFYNIQEDVTALYGMITFNKGPHTFLGGVRYERTEVNTEASILIDDISPGRVTREFDYDHFLPSFVYTLDVLDGVKLRAGYAQALGRPNHPELAGADTIDQNNDTFRRSNPALKPRESDSFDLAVDWFIAPGHFFSVAGFHKIIDNQISIVETQEEINGQPFIVRQPVNLDSVKVTGLEISYIDDAFEFLPAPFDGLGVSTNLTLMDGEDGPAPGGNLISQPDYLFNVSGLYNYGPFSARLTYNVVDDRPTSAVREEGRYQQLDMQVRWQINDNFQAQIEGRNITNNPRTEVFSDTGLVRAVNDFGNSWWFGLSYRY